MWRCKISSRPTMSPHEQLWVRGDALSPLQPPSTSWRNLTNFRSWRSCISKGLPDFSTYIYLCSRYSWSSKQICWQAVILARNLTSLLFETSQLCQHNSYWFFFFITILYFFGTKPNGDAERQDSPPQSNKTPNDGCQPSGCCPLLSALVSALQVPHTRVFF